MKGVFQFSVLAYAVTRLCLRLAHPNHIDAVFVRRCQVVSIDERHRIDVMVEFEVAHFLAGSVAHGDRLLVLARQERSEGSSIWRELNESDGFARQLDRDVYLRLVAVELPDADLTVKAGGGERLAVGRERDRGDRTVAA